MKRLCTLFIIFSLAANLTAQTISVSTSTSYQTFSGWEATAEAGQDDFPTEFEGYKAAIYAGLDDIGINRLRLEVHVYDENTVESTTSSANDNGDPNSANLSGFQFTRFDRHINKVVIPLRNALIAKGESLYLVLCYVDFRSFAYEAHDDSAEYAELISVYVNHMNDTFGFVPDAIETILEPDNGSNTDWTTTMLAANTNAAISRLASEGFTSIKAIIPSVTNQTNMDDWYDGAVSNGLTKSNVVSCSYHRYVANDGILASIIANCLSDSKTIGMNEWISADVDTLHTDLTTGMNSFWQQFTITYPDQSDNGAQYFNTNSSTLAVTYGTRTKLLRQYFKFIRAGAVRYSATSGNGNLKPVYFVNTNGTDVVVIRATASVTNFTVGGLPAGTYKIKYSTDASYDQDLSDVTIGVGENITTSIPAAGVLTIYQDAPASASVKQKFRGKTILNGKVIIK